MASGHVLPFEWGHVHPQKALAALAAALAQRLFVLREVLGIFDCWIFEIRLLYSSAFIQHSHRARISADIWESKLELSWSCAQTLPAAAVQHSKGKPAQTTSS